jgi:hypothetical protein
MASREVTVEEIMAILPQTPGRFAALTEGMTPAQLHRAPRSPTALSDEKGPPPESNP